MESFEFLGLTGDNALLLLAACTVVFIFFVVFCIIKITDAKEKARAEKERKEHYHRFYCIDSDTVYELYGLVWKDILVDRETRVQYFSTSSSMSPWIDADGKPILYTGNFDEYDEE